SDTGSDTGSGAAFTVRQVFGIILCVAAVACGIALSQATTWGVVWLLRILAGGCALGGTWLQLVGRRANRQLLMAVAGLGLGVLAFGALHWAWLGWPTLGAGCGGLCAWGYARRARAAWFTATLVCAVYGVAAAAGLLRCYRHAPGGEVWILAQGLGTIWVGWSVTQFRRAAGTGHRSRTAASGTDEQRAATDTEHMRGLMVRLSGRFCIITGIFLPYLALLLAAIGRGEP
ncbi:MAG: hypothetical protein ACOCYN_01845, partial [Planctomycetota bacterium]